MWPCRRAARCAAATRAAVSAIGEPAGAMLPALLVRLASPIAFPPAPAIPLEAVLLPPVPPSAVPCAASNVVVEFRVSGSWPRRLDRRPPFSAAAGAAVSILLQRQDVGRRTAWSHRRS